MPVEACPIDPAMSFGSIVTGLRRTDLVDPSVRSSLHDLWVDRGLLVFRGLPDDAETQIELSEVFGQPDVHPLKKALGIDDPDRLADIVADPERGDIVRVDGVELDAWLPWHFDLAYVAEINRGGVLRPVTLPIDGGQTGFLDGVEAYRRLPPDLLDEIADLWVVYQFDADLAGIRHGGTPGVVLQQMSVGTRALMDRLDLLPPAAHPLVYVQPATGRPVLNFSPWFALGVEGLDPEVSDGILDRVAAVMIDAEHAYFHDWQLGDMVLWDNWRMLHCATGVPHGTDRHMQRTTIAGDYGHGRPAEWGHQADAHQR